MTKFNRSEIMKNAWSIYRNRGPVFRIKSFAEALKRSWADAKVKVQVTAKATTAATMPRNLNVGDTVNIEISIFSGKASPAANRVIKSIEPTGLGFNGFTLRFEDGTHTCVNSYMPVRRVAVA